MYVIHTYDTYTYTYIHNMYTHTHTHTHTHKHTHRAIGHDDMLAYYEWAAEKSPQLVRC